MSADKLLKVEECGPVDRVLRHERELSHLTTITDDLNKKNDSILSTLNTLVLDIRIIKENLKDVPNLKEGLTEANENMQDLISNIKELKTGLEDNQERVKSLENSTSHLGWLNTGIKTTLDNFATFLIVGIVIIYATHLDVITAVMKFFK